MTDRNPQGPITSKCLETGKPTMIIAFNSVVFCGSAWAFVTILISFSFQYRYHLDSTGVKSFTLIKGVHPYDAEFIST